LLGEHYKKLWNVVKDELEKITDADIYAASGSKIENAFQAGYGTVLFYEDQRVVKSLQKQFASYGTKFPVWSQHTAAMHRYAIWMMLEEAGFGVSLQHYNPLIDEEVAKTWNLNPEWTLIAQMPFGGAG
jgi:predicted oxidoreductase (fatty acid repression mutant protein)